MAGFKTIFISFLVYSNFLVLYLRYIYIYFLLNLKIKLYQLDCCLSVVILRFLLFLSLFKNIKNILCNYYKSDIVTAIIRVDFFSFPGPKTNFSESNNQNRDIKYSR